MSKIYDATGKHLLEADPAGWAQFLGIARPRDKVKLIDTDLSAVTAAADKVIVIEDSEPWILDIEFQSWRDPSLPWQLLKYTALLHDKHKIPVASVLVVLVEKAHTPAYSGRHSVVPPFGPPWEFAYTVVKVWELARTAADRPPRGVAVGSGRRPAAGGGSRRAQARECAAESRSRSDDRD